MAEETFPPPQNPFWEHLPAQEGRLAPTALPPITDVKLDEVGAPPHIPEADAPRGATENPLLDKDEQAQFVKDGMAAWEEYEKFTKEDKASYKEGLPCPNDHWLMRLQYGGATVTEDMMEIVRKHDWLRDFIPDEETLGGKEMDEESATWLREKAERHWAKVESEVDDIIKNYEEYDTDVARIEEERAGVQTPFPEGNDWQWEVFRQQAIWRKKDRERKEREAKEKGEPPPPPDGPDMPNLEDANRAMEEMKAKGFFTEEELSEDEKLASKQASWASMRVALDLEAMALEAKQRGETDEEFPCSFKEMPEDYPGDEAFGYPADFPKPSHFYPGDDIEDFGDQGEEAAEAAARAAHASKKKGATMFEDAMGPTGAPPPAKAPSPKSKRKK